MNKKEQFIHVNENDTKFYFSDPEMTTLHREDGPALEWPDGYQEWYFNNKLHREDGPAVVDPNGYKAWYLHGERFDEEQFNERVDPPEITLTCDEIAEKFGMSVDQLKIKK